MKSCLILVFVLCLLVGCGGEPAPVVHDTPLEPVETDTPPLPTDTPVLSTPTPSTVGTRVREADGMAMVYVPAGEFPMGSTDADIDAVMAECSECERDWFTMEQPQHTVYLDGFWIDRTEVTNAQYSKCVEAGVCPEPGCWDDERFSAPDQPVVCVSWEDAQAYAVWAGGRLPTEAEWEKAASWDPERREKRVYPWGDNFDGSRLNFCDRNCPPMSGLGDNSVDDGYAYAAPVGSYPKGASFYGALDMSGNVWEWVADWYSEDYYASSPPRNPQGPRSAEDRVLRGGAFRTAPRTVRCDFRAWNNPDLYYNYIGFRVMVDPALSEP